MLRITTLLFVLKEDKEILLAMKKRGFGVGKWNGPGGKADAGETPEAAAKRECFEETGINPTTVENRGYLIFEFKGREEWNTKCHVFVVQHPNYLGEPTETEEMKPAWWKQSEIPYGQMWEDDRIWLPVLLKGEKVFYHWNFTADGKLIDGQRLPAPEG